MFYGMYLEGLSIVLGCVESCSVCELDYKYLTCLSEQYRSFCTDHLRKFINEWNDTKNWEPYPDITILSHNFFDSC